MPLNIEGTTYYNVREIASKLHVTPQTIRKFIKQGKLPAQRYGRPIVISEGQFREFLLDAVKNRTAGE